MKAFIVNRVGDFGFLIGIFLIFYHSGSINFLEIFSFFSDDNKIKLLGLKIEEVICFFLFIGAMGKSAQNFFAYMVTGCNGRSYTSFGAYPCSYHGHCGSVFNV